MKVLAGLGNPGQEYAQTRHNAGFMVLDQLCARHNLGAPKARFHGQWLEGRIAGHKVGLLWPMTFMNRSGMAVAAAMRFFQLEPADLLVLVDDLALSCGRIRVRSAGSPGGHNALADIEKAIDTSAYNRIRIGIDPPGRMAQIDYVLGRFSAAQREQLEPALEQACDAIECWLKEGVEQAMNRFNAAPGSP